MRLKALTIFFILVACSTALSAQPYKNAVGIKAGYSSGFIFQHFFEDEYALDVQGLYNEHGFQLNGLYKYQFSPYNKERLFYFGGVGVYGGNWNSEFALGAAVALGTEYVFWATPITLGLAWKPMINLYRTFDYALADLSLTFRVVF